MEREQEDEFVCLSECHESFFINDNYHLTTFTYGSHVLELFCLHSASTDFDLTGQMVWPGAVLLNEYLSKNAEMLQGLSVIELGSGVGITGVLCGRFCEKVVMTDHNDEVLKILKKNVDLQASPEDCPSADLLAQKLEWGSSGQMDEIMQRYPEGFDLVLGADICFQQSSIPLLFDTVKQLLQIRRKERCRFILAYISRAKVMDKMVVNEAEGHGLSMTEVAGTRSVVSNLEGVIYEITL